MPELQWMTDNEEDQKTPLEEARVAFSDHLLLDNMKKHNAARLKTVGNKGQNWHDTPPLKYRAF